MKLITLLALVVFCAFTANAQTNTVKIFNLADFQAVGDGVADDGPALQRALDAVAEAGGGTLLVPAGLYRIETPVVKDFAGLNGASVHIQGVPSATMPAPPSANGDQLAGSLDLASEFIPATGYSENAISLSNLDQLTIEHLAFTGRQTAQTDAFITLLMSDINHATVRHCEFYGISTFGLVPGLGGGNVIRAVRSELSIESSVFLGCTANSGAYAPIVDNVSWKKFTISNSIFIDYGTRSFFGKMGLGAPLSWINFGAVAPRTSESSRREVVIRDTFLDEGGWIGITAFGHLWGAPVDPIDLIYISGLKMNVSNLGTAGHQFYDTRNVLIENSHYGWSHNTGAAIDLYRSSHAILDRLTCIAKADRIRADARTERLTVINSVYAALDSQAQTTTEMQTEPEDDPVQYVRQQFLSLVGREPDPAAHFYWSDLLIRCGGDTDCLEAKQNGLREFLENHPKTVFSFAGTVTDETGNPISGITISLTGSQFASGLTNAQGKFQFSGLPTSGAYTVTVNQGRYSFTTSSETVECPAGDVSVTFQGRLNHYSISGRITKADGSGASGVTVQLAQSSTAAVTTDADGIYSFQALAAGQNYTIVPSSSDFVFFPSKTMFLDLSADRSANFAMRVTPELMRIANSEDAVALRSVSFISDPISIFDVLGFSNDGVRRVIVFARNLEGINDRSQFVMIAEDAEGQKYPLEIDFMTDVPQQSWLKQLNVKLSPELKGKCVQLRLSSGEIMSNMARLCLSEP